MKKYSKEWWEAARIRAYRTIAQALAASIPAGVVITASMIKEADWLFVLFTILGWLATGLLAGINSILTSYATGLPEVEEE